MRQGGARAPRISQLGEDRLVRATSRGASKPTVTARLDHRRCVKCGHEFTVRSSLTAVRRSLVVMERSQARTPCPTCESRSTIILSTRAFPQSVVTITTAEAYSLPRPTLNAREAHVYALLRELVELSLALGDLIGTGLSAAQEAAARDVLAAMHHVIADARQLHNPSANHTGRLRLVD